MKCREKNQFQSQAKWHNTPCYRRECCGTCCRCLGWSTETGQSLQREAERGQRLSQRGGSEQEARNTQPAYYESILRSHKEQGGRWRRGTWNNTGRYKRENGDPEIRRQQRWALFFQGHLWRWGRQAGAGRLGPFTCHSTQSSIFHKMFPSRGFLWVKLSIYKSINKANITNLVLN